MKNINVLACAPPRCSCPSIETVEDVDGEEMVVVKDDYNGICCMTIDEFKILAEGFLEALK